MVEAESVALANQQLRDRDREARRRAQVQFDRPLALEAGAGTGKTTTLVARILAWSLHHGWMRSQMRSQIRSQTRLSALPGKSETAADIDERIAADVLSRIVAITFTEAAAAEMASRVAEALARLAKGEVPSWLLPEAVPEPGLLRRRARALAATLDHFSARTIHAYCRNLLSQHALAAGLHPRLVVDAEGEQTEEIVREIVEEELQEAYGGPGDEVYLPLAADGVGPREIAEALYQLVQAGAPPALLAEPVHRSAGWRALGLRLHGKLEALATAGAALEGLPAHHRRGRAVLAATWRSLSVLQPLLGTSAPAPQSTAAPSARVEGRAIEPDTLHAILSELRALWSVPLERLATWGRGDFTQTEGQLLGPRRTPRVRSLCGELHPLLQHTLDLRPRRLELRRRALAPLYRQVRRELRRRGVLTFEDLLSETRALLVSRPAVVAEIRTQVEQVLVDEFQDTDHLQCDIVEQLALSTAHGEPRPGLFVVGDPKQSIFGWRSADLRAYHGFLNQVRQLGGSIHTLSENYRSVPAILDHVQRLVEPVMREEQGLQPRFVPLLASPERLAAAEVAAPDLDGPALEHWISWSADGPATRVRDAAELEAVALARDLRRLQRSGVAWKRIGVLFRSANDIGPYLEALRAADIPFLVARDPQYYRRREIIELTALIRTILDPTDHLALLTALRSIYIGVPDAALLPLWRAGLPQRFATLGYTSQEFDGWLAAVLPQTPSKVPGLERLRSWPDGLRAAARHVAELRRCYRREPAEVFVERLRHRFAQEALESSRYLGTFRLANLDRLLRRLRGWLEDGVDTSALLRRLRRNLAEAGDSHRERPADGEEDAVRLLTIHRAKGLDFRHVYVLQLHKQTSEQPREATEVATVRGATDGEPPRDEFRLLGLASPGFDLVRSERRAVADAERVRLLYVAVTRARRRLVLAGIWPPRTPDEAPVRSLADLIAHSVRVRRASGHAEGPSTASPSVGRLLTACEESGQPFLDRAGVRWFFPALVSTSDAPPPPLPASVELDALQKESAQLRLLRQRGRERMQRLRRRAASEEAHSELLEQLLSGRDGDAWDELQLEAPATASPPLDRHLAQAVGTVVHRALETMDLELTPDAAMAQQATLLPGWLRDLLPGALLDRALRNSQQLLESIARGRLLKDLWRLREHIVGREVPVWLPPTSPGTPGNDRDSGDPLEVVAGSIDLLYLDPATRRLVIADYKTDQVQGERELEQRVAAYRRQGSVYQQALVNALHLPEPPWFELWFLALDQRIRLTEPARYNSEDERSVEES